MKNRSFVDAKRRRALQALAALPCMFAPPLLAAQKPARVVSLSWSGAQILMTIGLPPLGIAERESYPTVGALPAMPPGTLELGLRDEPNLELLAQLKPDLIVIDETQVHLNTQLEAIAPVMSIDIYNPSRGKPLARAEEETRRLAARVGHEAQARAYLDTVAAQLAANAQSIAQLRERPVLIADLYDDGTHLFVYGPNSMLHDVMVRLGVRNAWRGSTESGYVLLGIEDLASMGDADMFYISYGARDQIALRNLSRSLLWRSLPFVGAGRFRPLPGFFTYGAAPCATQFASELTRALRAAGNAHG